MIRNLTNLCGTAAILLVFLTSSASAQQPPNCVGAGSGGSNGRYRYVESGCNTTTVTVTNTSWTLLDEFQFLGVPYEFGSVGLFLQFFDPTPNEWPFRVRVTVNGVTAFQHIHFTTDTNMNAFSYHAARGVIRPGLFTGTIFQPDVIRIEIQSRYSQFPNETVKLRYFTFLVAHEGIASHAYQGNGCNTTIIPEDTWSTVFSMPVALNAPEHLMLSAYLAAKPISGFNDYGTVETRFLIDGQPLDTTIKDNLWITDTIFHHGLYFSLIAPDVPSGSHTVTVQSRPAGGSVSLWCSEAFVNGFRTDAVRYDALFTEQLATTTSDTSWKKMYETGWFPANDLQNVQSISLAYVEPVDVTVQDIQASILLALRFESEPDCFPQDPNFMSPVGDDSYCEVGWFSNRFLERSTSTGSMAIDPYMMSSDGGHNIKDRRFKLSIWMRVPFTPGAAMTVQRAFFQRLIFNQ